MNIVSSNAFVSTASMKLWTLLSCKLGHASE